MKELPLSGGQVALIDDDVWEWASVYTWRVHWQGYVCRHVHRSGDRQHTVLLRREIMQAPRGFEVLNRNGDQLDNRRENLVLFTPAERAAREAARTQREGRRANNSSGFHGVSWDSGSQAWQARIWVARKLQYLGRFASPEEAAQA